ncbi:MAG: hypothetical protein JWR21_4354 [Herminiimonas sp.]|nr:hypothetical protein [Herminiimonas sp.]
MTTISSALDMRSIACMPVDVSFVLLSDVWLCAASDPVAAVAAISLLLRSWHQVPAGSIPGEDRVLAAMSQCDVTEWSRIRSSVLACWTVGDDGRYYNADVVAKAGIAAAERAKKEALSNRNAQKGRASVSSKAESTALRVANSAPKPRTPAAAAAPVVVTSPEVDPRQASLLNTLPLDTLTEAPDATAVAAPATTIEPVAAEPAATDPAAPSEVIAIETDSAPSATTQKKMTDAQMIFEHWKTAMKSPGAKFSTTRAALINRRLKEYTMAELLQSINGCARSEYHQGRNDTSTFYNSIELILRDHKHIEDFAKAGTGEGPRGRRPLFGQGGKVTPEMYGENVIDPHEEFMLVAGAREVFQHWKTVMNCPDSRLDKERESFLAELIKTHTRDDLMKAVDGCRKSAWHMGANDTNSVFNTISFIFDSAERIEQFIKIASGENANAPTGLFNQGGKKHSYGPIVIEPNEEFMLVADARRVFAHWKSVMNYADAVLDKDRQDLLTELLKTHKVEHLMKAVDGCKKSEWHQGISESGTVFNTISFIFGTNERIENFVKIASGENQKGPTGSNRLFGQGGKVTPGMYGQSVIHPDEEFRKVAKARREAKAAAEAAAAEAAAAQT